jgi:acetyl esterase/lipase
LDGRDQKDKMDYHEIHPELQRFAKMMPRMTFNSKNLRLWRFLYRFNKARRNPEDVHIDNIDIPSRDGPKSIRLRVYRRKELATPAPVLIWLHGGGYILGKPEQDDSTCIQYVREAGIVVVSVDYRCAPEQSFPKALQDSADTLKWAHTKGAQLGMDASRIAVGGASAGGGLAAALVQFAQHHHETQPVLQLLVYPMLDDRTCLRPDLAERDYLVWNCKSNRFGWEAYLGIPCGAENPPPFSVPARTEDLRGLPPAWIGVGSLDLFHDESVAYGQRLRDGGVACEIVVVPGAFHGFDLAGSGARVVRDFRRSQIAFMKRHLLP